ncbi:hypothetical protein [Solicola gregarius]|uniref:Uncharacterized protein n=1 Tax=Solicola gregarius TaxID=2908642 RepID=A0AA46YIX4_9ACTN|nr:hypothetical protein [Solicola gregarius]UYM03492.1 hypothetical protein L0C25_13085 [Solicola gregarius]
MTEQHPESVPDESSEGDALDQRAEIDEPDDEAVADGLVDDAWGADIADVAEQQIPVPQDVDDDF